MKIRNFLALFFVLLMGLPALAQDTTGSSPSTVVIQLPPTNATPAPPRPTGITDIVKSRFPLAMTYADFGLGWRELTYQGQTYLTKGDTATLDNVEYLVAYKFVERDITGLGNRDYIASATNQSVPHQPDDRFELTLLRASGVIPYLTEGQTNLRSFTTAHNRPSLDPANFSDSYDQSLSIVYLHKIYDAVNAYSAAYLNILPPMQTAFAAQKALIPYAENAVIFTQPGTNQPFKANPNLSNRKRAHLYKRGRVVLFYEAQPAPDGLRAVLQLNGLARRVDAKTWAKLSADSGLDQS